MSNISYISFWEAISMILISFSENLVKQVSSFVFRNINLSIIIKNEDKFKILIYILKK